MATSIIYGLYVGGVAILVTLLEFVTGMSPETSQSFGYLITVAMALGVYFGIRERRKSEWEGDATTSGGVATGTIVGLTAGVISAIFTYIYMTRINPDMIDAILQTARQSMEAQKSMTADQIDKAMKVTSIFVSPSMFAIIGLLMSVVTGLCVGWIVMVRRVGYVFVALLVLFGLLSVGKNPVSGIVMFVLAALLVLAEVKSDRWRFPKSQPIA